LDLVQESFVSAHDALARFDPARSLRAWLSGIASAASVCASESRSIAAASVPTRSSATASAAATGSPGGGGRGAGAER
jgi:DNA-directed RNA polymerase specialized sigma24 family protein